MTDEPAKKLKVSEVSENISKLIEICRHNNWRSLFLTLSGSGEEKVSLADRISPIIAAAVAERPRLKTLWLYDKNLLLSNKNQEKKIKKNKLKNQVSNFNFEQNDSFQQFINSTQIKYCFYNESQNILGSTYDICVLQDFAALTPNVIARAVETVSGGGLVIFNVEDVSTLTDISKIHLKSHDRMSTSLFPDQNHRFTARLINMLLDCKSCIVLDSKLNPINDSLNTLKKSSNSMIEKDFSKQINDFAEIADLFAILQTCATSDQIDSVLKIFDSICLKDSNFLVYLTSARGRGKSAILGMSLALCIALGHSNIFVVSPSPENLITLFQFVSSSLSTLGYQENKDFALIFDKTLSNANSPGGLITSVNVTKNHRQFIKFVYPNQLEMISNPELICIDEAAAIPIPLVRRLLKNNRVIMASTVSGYEGTGRSLSLKLVEQIKANVLKNKSSQNFDFKEIVLNEPIRYANDDPVEKWLNSCLCLGPSKSSSSKNGSSEMNFPTLGECKLMKINRDILFSSHPSAEEFLSKLMDVFSSAHYRNSPNDLLSIADSSSYELFCLVDNSKNDSSNVKSKQSMHSLSIITVILICYEGNANNENFNKSYHTSGNLIPNVLSQAQLDSNFQKLNGVRIIRIATNHFYQKMGYGSHALNLLTSNFLSNKSNIETAENNSLLVNCEKLQPKLKCDYIGVSFGITAELYPFWEKHNFIPMYLSNSENKLTGEHSLIMLKTLSDEQDCWVKGFNKEFLIRQIRQSQTVFKDLDSKLASNLVSKREYLGSKEILIDALISPLDLKRLSKYKEQRVNMMNIADLTLILAILYFHNLIDVKLSPLNQCVLMAVGLQGKSFDQLSAEIDLAVRNINGIMNQIIINFSDYLNDRQLNKAVNAVKNKTLSIDIN